MRDLYESNRHIACIPHRYMVTRVMPVTSTVAMTGVLLNRAATHLEMQYELLFWSAGCSVGAHRV